MTTREQDQALEGQILAAGLNAPRVTVEQIDALVAGLSYHTYVIPGTTTTVAAAIGPGDFVVGLGMAAAASVENFDEVIGRNRAISKAQAEARNKLWELEGWRLKLNLLDMRDAGLLGQALSPELVEAFGDQWHAVAIPAAVLKAAAGCPCSRCDKGLVRALPAT
ncbi:Gp49 family protein [Pseudomonas aeruginosa]|uniref:Gp49 family protein n=1 Tax=Pseudomonas aeruginosa TaxID=287 RepID=UPI0038917F53